MTLIRRWWSSEDAQDLVEWALIIALVIIGSAALMFKSGSSVSKVWSASSSAFAGAVKSPSGGGGGDGGDGGDKDR